MSDVNATHTKNTEKAWVQKEGVIYVMKARHKYSAQTEISQLMYG